ncbi:MAG: hypothetical protein ACE37N_05640 [Pseudohongiellaceae bacterium]
MASDNMARKTYELKPARDGVALVAESANGEIAGEVHACSPGVSFFCMS